MGKCAQVGGQAVLEGVMMRSPRSLAIAVRRPNNEIVVKEAVWRSLWDKLKFLRWPFLRGTVVMIEAMVNGMQALSFSAKEAMPEDEVSRGGASKEPAGAALVLPIIVSTLLAIGLFKFVPHIAATYAGYLFRDAPFTVDDLAYHFVDGLVKVVLFIAYIAAISAFEDIRRVFQFHGAEHMSIYTFEAGEALTVANARRKSTLHPRCGTAFLMVVILIFIVASALVLPLAPEWVKPGPGRPWYNHILLVLLKLPLLVPVAGIAYEFNRFAGRHAESRFIKPVLLPGLAMQLLTTRRPDDAQIEIALAALKTALWRERVGESVPEEEAPRVFSDFAAFEGASCALEATGSND
jgi:uncharacterized protein YqhQ